MSAALTMVFRCLKTPAVVLIENNMLALVSDDVADTVEVFGMFRYEKRSGIERHDPVACQRLLRGLCRFGYRRRKADG